MLPAWILRMSAKHRTYGLIALVAVALVAVAMAEGGPSGSNAQTLGTCNALTTTATSASCSFTTSTAVAPGGTLVIAITSPANATITNVTGLPTGCVITTGQFTQAVTILCDATSNGIPSGTTLTETVAFPAATGALTETVTYNANGPLAAGPPPTTTPGTCTGAFPDFSCTNATGAAVVGGGTLAFVITAGPDQTVSLAGATTTNGTCTPVTPPTFTCTNTPGAVTAGGQTLSLAITAAPGQTITVPAGGAPPTVGTCPLSTTLPAGPSAAGGTLTINYACSDGQTTGSPPPPVTITVTASGAASTVTNGTCTAYPPAPAVAPFTSTCTNTPAQATPAGGMVTLTIVAPSGGTITSATPLPAGTCGVPSVSSLPAMAVTITYTCAAGESIPANTPIQVSIAGDGPAGGQPLEQTASSSAATAPTEVTTAGSPIPPVLGTCPLSSPATGTSAPSGTLTITYTCTSGEMIPAGTTLTIPITAGGNPVPVPTEETTANALGAAGAVPAPTQTTLAFTIIFPTPTVSPTALPLCIPGSTAGTATPVNCVSSSFNCVNTPLNRIATPVPGATTPNIATNGPYKGATGQPVQFNGAAEPTAGHRIVSCTWDFGDGSKSRFLNASHTYVVSGPYNATLTVVDSSGAVATASTSVLIAPVGQLCQTTTFPLGPGLAPCAASPNGCPAASFNNACQPTCPYTGETLLPNQCPGPAPSTANSIWVNGPFNVLVDQPVSVNVNTNVGMNSPLLPGDVLKFDWGDGQVTFNTPQPGVVPGLALAGSGTSGGASGGTTTTTTTTGGVTTTTTSCTGLPSGVPCTTVSPYTPPIGQGGAFAQPIGGTFLCADGTAAPSTSPVACANNGGPVQPLPPGLNAAFPAPMQASHAYTEPGTYIVNVTLTFSDGTSAVASTTVNVGGSPASLTTNEALGPGPLPSPGTIALAAGCNTVTLTFGDGTPVGTVVAAVSGANVVSVGENPANAPPLVYYPGQDPPGNLASVRHGDTAIICVDGPATLTEPAS